MFHSFEPLLTFFTNNHERYKRDRRSMKMESKKTNKQSKMFNPISNNMQLRGIQQLVDIDSKRCVRSAASNATSIIIQLPIQSIIARDSLLINASGSRETGSKCKRVVIKRERYITPSWKKRFAHSIPCASAVNLFSTTFSYDQIRSSRS